MPPDSPSKLPNQKVSGFVRRAVDQAVYDALNEAVSVGVYGDGYMDEFGAVNRVVQSTVYRAVREAVHGSTHETSLSERPPT